MVILIKLSRMANFKKVRPHDCRRKGEICCRRTILALKQGINVYCSIVFFCMVYALIITCIHLVSVFIIGRLGIDAFICVRPWVYRLLMNREGKEALVLNRILW